MKSRNRQFYIYFLAMILLGAASGFASAPTISGFSPASGVLSSTVTITGTNFVSPATVSFNGVASTLVSVSSSTTIHATVPPTASTGTITVTSSGGSAASTSAFTVLPGAAVTPSAVGPPTTALTLYYSGFGAYDRVDVYFDTEDIALSAASATGAGNIAITIPKDARPGAHWLTANDPHSGNAAQIAFTVRTSWPQVGLVPTHKGNNRYENVVSNATVSNLEEAWRTSAIGDVECTPAVVNGIVYASFGDGSIRAFDETTGAQKWSYQTGGTDMYSSPAVSNGIVYAGSTDFYLYALDAVTGSLKWRQRTGNPIYSSPNVVNGIVYFGSFDNKVYALNATTGAVVWSYPTAGPVYGSPMVASGVVYVGSSDSSVYALNAATGAKIWSFATTGGVVASPVIMGGLICVGAEDATMYGLYAQTGTQAWTYKTPNSYNIDSSAAAVGGAIFFSDDCGVVYSLSSSGVLRWSTQIQSAEIDILSPVCVANGVVYIRNADYTYVIDQNTGSLLTTLPVGSLYGGAVVVNGAMFGGDLNSGVLVRYTLNALLSNYVAPRPDPMQLRPHHLR